MKKWNYCIVCGVVLCFSCAKRTEIVSPVPQKTTIRLSDAEIERLPLVTDNHRRTQEAVLAFSESYLRVMCPETKIENGSLSISDSVLMSGLDTKGDELSVAPIYVVSRGEGEGFLLVGGDNRIDPVWGFIESGDYCEGVNPGFDILMEHLKAQVLAAVIAKEQLRDSVYDVLQTKLGLNGIGKTKVVIDPNDPFTPPDYGVPEHFDRTETVELYPYYENEYEYGPLMKTKWGQGWPYNSEVIKAHPNCPVGCTATAVAQVMAYHKYPSYMSATGHTYLWERFGADNKSNWDADAVASVGYLMQDLGLPQYLNIKYATGGSGAGKDDIPDAYRGFGYTVGSYQSYGYTAVYNEVKAGRPVSIIGGNGKNYTHAWVTDGALLQHCWVTTCIRFYLNDQLIHTIEADQPTKKSSGYSAHHNFGWNGLDNGWFANLDPIYIYRAGVDANTFNKSLKILTGIQPKQ